MRVAVFSDMHGNAVAFDAVLADLRHEAPDRLLCLGDTIQGGPEPGAVVERLRALVCPVVMGNADAFLLGAENHEPADEARRLRLDTVREWTLSRLAAEDLSFLRGFAPRVTVALEGDHALLGFHGSPSSYDDQLFPHTSDEEMDRLLAGAGEDVLCGGHTHVPFVRRRGPGMFFNPGSVGLAYDHRQPEPMRADPWAEYALLTSRGRDLALEFRRVHFDVAALRERYRTSGRPFADEALRQYGG